MRSEEYIKFVEVDSSWKKTRHWEVRTTSSDKNIGEIYWYGPWRQYVFVPWPMTIYSPGCMDQISTFVGKQTKDHRTAKRLTN